MRMPIPASPQLQKPPKTSRISVASKAFPVVVHPFSSQTPHYCAYERGNPDSRSAFVYIGGLSSGPHTTVELITTLLTALDEAGLGFSIWEFRMRSSYTGWGQSTLDNDAQDIAALIAYLRKLGKRSIVLMGSSTGCQDCLRYMEDDLTIDAYILQGPTSDRLTATTLMTPEDYQRSLRYTKEQITLGNITGTVPREFLPDFLTSPIAVHRWLSLISAGYIRRSHSVLLRLTTISSNEDYFHPDLDDETMGSKFHVMKTPTLILPSENDELIPPTVDKAALLQRWIVASSLLVSQMSAVVLEADHTLSTAASRRWVADRVVQFLRHVDDVHV